MALPRTNSPILPPEPDDFAWTSSFFFTHLMTDESRRYGYMLWFGVALVLITFSILHWTGSRQGWIGVLWTKHTLRRRTWRKKSAVRRHKQPIALPSNAQMGCLIILGLFTILLCTVGDDYIYANDFTTTSTLPKLLGGNGAAQFATGDGVLLTNATQLGPGTLYSPTRYSPLKVDYTISKAWWTQANRWGIICYAMLPLCVIFVLKAAPFNIFAFKYSIQLHSDKLAWLHRWSGRMVIFLVFGHVLFWSVQLGTEVRAGTDSKAYPFAFLWQDFVYGWIGFILFCLIGATSLPWMRENHFDLFYYLHLVLVPLALIASALHHPPTGWWAWTALAFWVAERIYREIRKFYMNGYFQSLKVKSEVTKFKKWDPKGETDEKTEEGHGMMDDKKLQEEEDLEDAPQYLFPGRQNSKQSEYEEEYIPQAPTMPMSSLTIGYLPPPGFVHAELISGRTVRLRLVTPGFIKWAPGQYFNLRIPSIGFLGSHPFTTASICDQQTEANDGRVIVFLIRAKNGWTKDLWDHLALLTEKRLAHSPHERPPTNATLPPRGALLRMHVDGPFGSAERAKWGRHSTVLIVAGGSGVSFGLSVLEFCTMCMAGRDAASLGSTPGGWTGKRSNITRVRFVWLIREFAHIQWCASAIRRCLAIAPPGSLQIDIHVTLAKPDPRTGTQVPDPVVHSSKPGSRPMDYAQREKGMEEGSNLIEISRHGRNHSTISVDDPDDAHDDGHLAYNDTASEAEIEIGNNIQDNEEEHPLDFTNFDGEDDGAIAGEESFSRNIRLEGKLRRANTRRQTNIDKKGLTLPTHDLPPLPRFDHNIPNSPLASSPLTGVGRFNPTSLATPSPVATSELDSGERSDRMSIISAMSQDHIPSTPMINEEDANLRLEVDVSEVDDIAFLSEYALKGRPKLDRIIKLEQERSKGSMVVANCGPTALNANLRKIISARIDPGRVRSGDMRGCIELVSEEFNT